MNGEEKEKLKKKAIERYGLTDNCRRAGFILDDGKMLDFGKGDEKYRVTEHETIGTIDPSNMASGLTGINRFIDKTESIRISTLGKSNIYGIPKQLTKKQEDKIEDCICQTKPNYLGAEKYDNISSGVWKSIYEDFDTSGDCIEDSKELKKKIAKIQRESKAKNK